MRRITHVIRQFLFAPLVLMFGIPDGGATTNSSGGDPSAASASAGAPAASGQQPTANPDAAAIASEILGALEKRSQRFEGNITKTVAEKYGMNEDEVSQILAAEKEKRDKALPKEVQKQIDDALEKANARLVTAEITAQATVLGFRDSDVAAALIDRKCVTVGDDGAVSGVKEALEALLKTKPYLAKDTGGSWGQRQGSPASGDKTTRDEMKDLMFGGKK